jgi:DnaJ-class molecular chaperone
MKTEQPTTYPTQPEQVNLLERVKECGWEKDDKSGTDKGKLNASPEACPSCGGRGWRLTWDPNYVTKESEDCHDCHGTGKKPIDAGWLTLQKGSLL